VAKAPTIPSNIITTNQLSKLKLKAIRAGVWFKALPRLDRVLVDLTIKVADSIRSSLLAKSIFEVVTKLEHLFEGKFIRLARTVGQKLAEKVSLIAQAWGNLAAKSWSTDHSFAVYLAVMQRLLTPQVRRLR
jgi:hypothetical protein